MRVLVTGGAGFIGAAIVNLLAAGGHDVVVLDRRAAPRHRRVRWIEGDLRDGACVRAAVRGVDAVSHQAAMVGLGVDFGDVEAYVDHNARGTAVLLRELHRTGFDGRIVLASSMVVYGEGRYRCPNDGAVRPIPRRAELLAAGRFEPECPMCGGEVEPVEISEDDRTDPRNVYAATKLHQEHLCEAFAREHNSPLVALRYHNVYGPGMPRNTPYAGVAALFLDSLARGERPRVFEDGGQRRDFVHVDDVARANLAALTAPASVNGSYNVASGQPRTVLELAQALCDASTTGLVPDVVGGYRLGDVRHIVASPQRMQERLGFRARIDLATGVESLTNTA